MYKIEQLPAPSLHLCYKIICISFLPYLFCYIQTLLLFSQYSCSNFHLRFAFFHLLSPHWLPSKTNSALFKLPWQTFPQLLSNVYHCHCQQRTQYRSLVWPNFYIENPDISSLIITNHPCCLVHCRDCIHQPLLHTHLSQSSSSTLSRHFIKCFLRSTKAW